MFLDDFVFRVPAYRSATSSDCRSRTYAGLVVEIEVQFLLTDFARRAHVDVHVEVEIARWRCWRRVRMGFWILVIESESEVDVALRA